ncbi:hypothetical protein Tco_0201130 [Tanacetum coccineum]
MDMTEEKVDSSKALDASLVIIESNGTESQEQDTSSRSGNDAHDNSILSQPEFNNEGDVDKNAKQCNDIRPLPAKLTDKMTPELSDQSLESENVCTPLKYGTSINPNTEGLELFAEKRPIPSENRASRNFDLMIIKWRLLKITLQAPFLNVQMTSVHISSGLVLHQMTSDHNRSELGIQTTPA